MSTLENDGNHPKKQQKKSNKYITFLLDKERYGFELLKVREIIQKMEITPIPRLPHFVNGIINLRGKIIPVFCLRKKFSMPPGADDETTCIIVVEVQGYETGLLVDKVSNVTPFDDEDIEPPPRYQHFDDFEDGGEVIKGISKKDDEVTILLNVDKVILEKGAMSTLQSYTNSGKPENIVQESQQEYDEKDLPVSGKRAIA